MIEIPNYRQTTDYTCGATSLLSILVHYGFCNETEMTLAEKLDTNPGWGTDPADIERVLLEYGFEIESRSGMSFNDLEMMVEAEMPVLVTYQAWSESDQPWNECWEDGHYSVVIGMDDENVYLEDPSLAGEIGYIPRQEFLERWHDIDRKGNELKQFGLVILNNQPKQVFRYRRID